MSSPQEREDALFQAAIQLDGAERVTFLDGACSGAPALRQRLEALLEAHASPNPAPLEISPPDKSTIKLDLPNAPDEAVGQTLGRYRLLERIGEGGFGVVYVAEQTIPVRRRVALKVIKLGMDTKQVVARFAAERQAIAMMDHPNIARVLDAGATETGRPYFVMELVRGVSLTNYCDEHKLSTLERLDLFIKVCQAIQHAHQKGIIHRDIKPSNVLVSLHDGVPVPKVIDFGIAKATQGRLSEATVFTQLDMVIGTPAYMSPEQVGSGKIDIDTRSDIYSLGALLYELLAGRTPFDANELMAQGVDQLMKTIRDTEPMPPASRLARLKAPELRNVARNRSTEPARLIQQIKGDLDWIVLKCLEKDRTRRYESASGLAADLRRHLTNEPVMARPPSAAYRIQKAFRRHRLVFAAGAAVATALLIGLVATTWQSVRATRAKHQAVAAQAEAVAAQASETALRIKAQAQELAARQRAYASDMTVIPQALDDNNLGRALDLLNRQRPAPGQRDLRGWEWRYLWAQTRSDALYTLTQESSEINSLAASPDGRWLAIGDLGKGGVAVWDLPARQAVIRLAETASDVHVAFSHAGSLLAFTGGVPTTNGAVAYALHLWNPKTRQMVAEIPLENPCKGLVFSQDGKSLLTSTISDIQGRTTRWSVPGLSRLADYPGGKDEGKMTTSFAATSDLGLAAHGTVDNHIQVTDLHDGREFWSVPIKSGTLMALAFSPDGRILASAEGSNDSGIRLWDVASGRSIGELEGHGDWVTSLTFWPDGKTLASSSADQTIRIWDVASRTGLDVLRGHQFGVWRVALSPDGKTLISGCKDGTVCVWNTSVLHPRQPFLAIPEQIANWCFAPDSQSVLTFGWQGHVTRWAGDALQTSEVVMDLGTNYDPVFYTYSVFSPDRRYLANGSANGIIRVWDLVHGSLLRQISNSGGTVKPVEFLVDGNRLVTQSEIGSELHEWDLATGQELQSWPAMAEFAGMLNFGDSNRLFEFNNSGQVRFGDLASGQFTVTNLDFLGVYAAAASPGGQNFVVASTYGYARVWDTASWQEAATLKGSLTAANSVAFAPDGQRLAIGSGKQQAVSLWDTASWQNVLNLSAAGAGFFRTAFSPDGNSIGSCDVDGTLQIWRAPSWEQIKAAEAKEKAPPPQP